MTLDTVTLEANGRSVTMTGDGFDRTVDQLTGVVRRRKRPEPTRANSLAWDAVPDDRAVVPFSFPSVRPPDEEQSFTLPLVESPLLERIAEGLIERHPRRYGPLAKQRLAFLFAPFVGNQNGEPRVWKLRRADDWTTWTLGQAHPPRRVDGFLVLASRVCGVAEFTNWQLQAAVHEALECLRVERGKLKILPRTTAVAEYIARRYGAWMPDMQALLEAVGKSEQEQLALWEEDEDEDDDVPF